MTDLQWTREKPTQPGWYWFRFVSHKGSHVRNIIRGHGETLLVEFADRFCDLSALADAEFSGPLTPPVEPPKPTHDFKVGDLVVSRNGGQVMRVIDSRRGGVRCIWPIPSDAEVWERDDHYYAPEFLVLLARPEIGIPH